MKFNECYQHLTNIHDFESIFLKFNEFLANSTNFMILNQYFLSSTKFNNFKRIFFET